MNSKIEARNEAVRLAVNVRGVTKDNLIEVSEKIMKFIIGDAELPEAYDTNAIMREVFSRIFHSPSYPAYNGKTPTETEGEK